MNSEFAAVSHAETQNIHVLAGAGTDGFGEERHADPHQLTLSASLSLFATEFGVSGHVHGLAHGRLVVAGVVYPPGLCFVWELFGFDEVLQAQFGRVHLEFVGQTVHDSLDEVNRFSDTERTRIGDTAGCLVGVYGGHLGRAPLQGRSCL